jgi:hypothetical protein
MIGLVLVFLACGSLSERPGDDSQSGWAADSNADTGGSATSDTDTDSIEVDPSAPVIGSCDAWCYYHTTGEQFYEWTIDCAVTDPEGPKNIWNGRWACTSGDCAEQSGLVACTTSTGKCNTSFQESQVTPTILCEQAANYTFSVWVSDWDGHESRPYQVTGRQQ